MKQQMTFHFHELVLFNNICHLFLLLLALVHFLLELGDLFMDCIEPMSVR